MKKKAIFLDVFDRAFGINCKYVGIKSVFYNRNSIEYRFVKQENFKEIKQEYDKILDDDLFFNEGQVLGYAFGDSMGEIEEYFETNEQNNLTTQKATLRVGDRIKVINENEEYNTYKAYIEHLIEWFDFPRATLDKFAIKELEKGEVGQVVFIGRHLVFDCPIILIKTQHGYNLINESGVMRIE